MAKTLSEQLLALLDADGQAKVKAAMAANPTLIAQDLRGAELIDVWANFGGELEPTTTTTTAVHVPTVPSAASTSSAAAPVAATTPTVPVVASNGTADGLARVLAELEGLKSTLSKDFVPAAKLPEYRAELLTLAIKSADDYASVRESHRDEFKEPLDRGAFEKFVADQAAAGNKHSSMSAAHDVFVKDKRVTAQAAAEKSRIDAAVAEALKQQRSSNVPGQTQQIAQSPAQQVMAKAKAAANGTGAETAALKAARQMEELDRNRASVQ